MIVADETLRADVARRLAAFHALSLGDAASRHAAVAVVIVEAAHGADLPGLPQHASWSTDAALLLTRRAQHLSRHAGQWALPGGRVDAGESAEAAALRELHEEVGLQLPAQAVLGRLDDFATRSGYVITPVVVWAGAAAPLVPDPAEVLSAHRIPVHEFMREDAPILERLAGSEHPVLKMPVGSQWIAAPTAAILYQFREVCIAGRATRVAHYEQPWFAWR